MCLVPKKKDGGPMDNGARKLLGNWYKEPSGYLARNVWINKNTKRLQRKHRLVAEKMLGRKLKRGEVVHHINGKRDDNRMANLEVLSSSEHMKEHWKDKKYISRMRPVLLKNARPFKKGFDPRRGWPRKPDAVLIRIGLQEELKRLTQTSTKGGR